MGKINVDSKNYKKRSIIFGLIAGAGLLFGIVMGALLLKAKENEILYGFAGALGIILFIIFIVLFALALSNYKKIKNGISLDAEDPKLKSKVVTFGVCAIVSFIVLVLGLLLLEEVFGEVNTLIAGSCFAVGIIGTIVFLILFINFVNKFKRLNK